jgi:hypothetical protein
LEWQERRAKHSGTEEWRMRVPAMRNDVLQNGARASRLAVYCYFRWVAAKFRNLSERLGAKISTVIKTSVRALEPIEEQTADRLNTGKLT